MPEGDKKQSAEERIIELFTQGSISSEEFESMIKELAESSRVADIEERLPSLGGEDPSAPEMDKKAAAYSRVSSSGQEAGVSSSGQEAACVEFAESLGYRVDEGNVYCDVWSGGGADA